MFESIRLDEELARNLGLEPVSLDRLDRIVAVAGPNGAGKTRLLRLLSCQLQATSRIFDRLAKHVRSRLGEPEEEAGDHINALLHYTTNGLESHEGAAVALATLLFGLFLDPGEELPDELADDELFQRVQANYSENLRSDVESLSGSLRPHGGLEGLLRAGSWPRVVWLSFNSRDARHLERDYSSHREATILELRDFPETALREAATVHYLSEHPEWAPRHDAEIARATNFRQTITTLLGLEVGAQASSTTISATVAGRRLRREELSAGQRLLIRWAEIIHQTVDDARKAILFIDEPELHLHPSAVVEVVNRLRALEPAQIWLATHSVPLLAALGPRRIVYMEDGCASSATRRVDHVLDGLLGGDDGVGRLRTFLGDAAALAFHNFAAECLTLPRAVELRAGDRQGEQVSTQVAELLARGKDEVLVLEYAAGQGRLIEALSIAEFEGKDRLRYFAYNSEGHTSADERERCLQHLQRLHGDEVSAEQMYTTDLREQRREHSDKMHAVILCNVLHEIPPVRWPELMRELRDCLREDGRLLVFEDQLLSEGELPHAGGFVILDGVELRAMFGLSSEESELLNYSMSNDERLSVAEVPAHLLARADADRVREALEMLSSRALREIESLRSLKDGSPQHRLGRRHAFFALLHTNATMALRGVGG